MKIDTIIAVMKKQILIVDDVVEYVQSLGRALSLEYDIAKAFTLEDAKKNMSDSISLALVDIRLSEDDMVCSIKGADCFPGGERQTMAIAAALTRSPRLLLLDEPSAGLSPKIVQEVLAKIHEIRVQLGMTILSVEQNVGQALKVTDHARCSLKISLIKRRLENA